MLISLDSESSYSKERDIKSLGATNYIRHPETDHYLISLWCPEWQLVCPPEKIPWEKLEGQTLISHNRSYDQRVVAHIRPSLKPADWFCTADLVSYIQSPRSLKDASARLLGVRVSKEIRDDMRGEDFRKLGFEEQEAVRAYALKDAELCWQLWHLYGDRMPEHERALSRHTTLLTQRGIGVDLEALETGANQLNAALREVEKEIPWAGFEAITSPIALRRECRKLNIDAPTSTAAKSEEWDEWAAKYEDQVPLVKAIQTWRSVNRTLKVLQAMQVRQSGAVLPVELKYFGASHTGRWSGSGGLNMQNLPRKPVFGVDCRSMLVPRGGNKFIVADYAQIEARVLLWLAGDEAMLQILRTGQDLYEAHARQTMGYSDPRPLSEVDPGMRQFAKARVLGLGYGLGATKFQKFQEQYTRKAMTAVDAKRMVDRFRASNPKIVRLWNQLGRAAEKSVGDSFFCELPSGRKIEYFNVTRGEDGVIGRVERGGYTTKLWGGRLCENLVQATAREILADAILRLEAAGLPVVHHVHDEVIVEAPADALEEIERIMQQGPEWAEGCPISVEAKALERYTK